MENKYSYEKPFFGALVLTVIIFLLLLFYAEITFEKNTVPDSITVADARFFCNSVGNTFEEITADGRVKCSKIQGHIRIDSFIILIFRR